MDNNNESLSDSDNDNDGFFLKPIKIKNKKGSLISNSKIPNNDITTSTISELDKPESYINRNEICKKNESKIDNHLIEDKIKITKTHEKINEKIQPEINISFSYIKIDKSNKFTTMTNRDKEIIEDILSSFKKKKSNINTLFIPILERISPNCNGDAIIVSKSLSKEIFKYQKITKNLVEKYLNYFFSLRYELLYSTNFFLSIKAIRYLGFILSYTYNKFHFYSIKSYVHFSNLAKKTVEIHEDALIDFYNSINDLGEEENTENHKKMIFWKKNRTKYLVPPEVNFLINRFVKIKTCEIELDFQGASIDSKDFNLISLFLLNINCLFVSLDHLKINFINQEFQYDIYTSYFHDLISSTKISNNIIRKNNIINPELIYNKKWNFIDKFNLQEYRVINKKKIYGNFNQKNLIFDDYNLLYINYQKNEINEEQMLNSTIEKTKIVDNDVKFNKKDKDKNNIKFDFTILEGKNININKIIKGKTNYLDIVKKNENFLNLIALLISSIGILSKMKNLDIIMNESYNNEFIINSVSLFDIDSDSINSNIHILDLLYNRIKSLENFNIEMNSLDNLTFYKMLNIIYQNQQLISLNISFFSSDATYFLRPLLKLCNQTVGDVEYLIKYNDIKIEETILNLLLPFFIENLSILFTLLKKSQTIQILGLNFDLPIILLNQQNYIISIIKFILNIIFLINNKKCHIKNLTILAPSIILDERTLPGINKTFSEIDIYKGEEDLKELNLQIQFDNILTIKNLISTKLVRLNLGDLDLASFKHISKYLTSYQFSSESILETLSIRLNNSLTYFSTDIKLILRELFYIKLKKLYEINIFTNIIIKNESNYRYLINILKYNWISEYTITFNSISNELFNKLNVENNGITYLINREEDQIFWYLKYIFNCRYKNYGMNFISIKNCINSILKYLYPEKEVKINFGLEKKTSDKKS